MKSLLHHVLQRVSILVLVCVLWLGGGLCAIAPVHAVEASPKPSSPAIVLPASVKAAVLKDATQRLKLPTSDLRIQRSERKTWPDGCLGLADPDVLCTQALVSGWAVTVQSKQQRLIYRTNASGSVVKLDTAASRGLNPKS